MKIIKKISTFISILFITGQTQPSEYESYAAEGMHYLNSSQNQVSHRPAISRTKNQLNTQQRTIAEQPTIQSWTSRKPEKILFTPEAHGLFNGQSHVVSTEDWGDSIYYPYTKIAYVQMQNGDRQYYQNIIEHTPNPSIGPADISPSKNSSKLQLIGSYKNNIAQSKNGHKLIGAPSPETELYGEVSQEIPVVSIKNSKSTEDGTYNPIDATAEITLMEQVSCDSSPAIDCAGAFEVKKKYVNVQLYFGGGRTPPTVHNHNLKMIGTIPNPFAKRTGMIGAQSKAITLYGTDSSKLIAEKYGFHRKLELVKKQEQDTHHDEGDEKHDQTKPTEDKPNFFDEFEPGLPF